MFLSLSLPSSLCQRLLTTLARMEEERTRLILWWWTVLVLAVQGGGGVAITAVPREGSLNNYATGGPCQPEKTDREREALHSLDGTTGHKRGNGIFHR